MSSFSSLKTAIANAIKANGNQEITGNLLQGILLSIVETLGDSAINTLETGLSNEATTRGNADTNLNNLITGVKNNVDNGYVYAGIAIPTTSPVSGKVFYIATKAGTYTNLGGLSVTEGITILKYNGSTWSKEQVIYGDGGVYDVTAQNGGTTFASLEALLGSGSLSTLIPTAVRKGGMSIKFVQSSDNKYLQYRLMSSVWSAAVGNWQGLDDSIDSNSKDTDIPTVGSTKKYIYSDDEKVDYLAGNINKSYDYRLNLHRGIIIDSNGNIATSEIRSTFQLRLYEYATQIKSITGITDSSISSISWYTERPNFIDNTGFIERQSTSLTFPLIIPSGAKYAVIDVTNSHIVGAILIEQDSSILKNIALFENMKMNLCFSSDTCRLCFDADNKKIVVKGTPQYTRIFSVWINGTQYNLSASVLEKSLTLSSNYVLLAIQISSDVTYTLDDVVEITALNSFNPKLYIPLAIIQFKNTVGEGIIMPLKDWEIMNPSYNINDFLSKKEFESAELYQSENYLPYLYNGYNIGSDGKRSPFNGRGYVIVKIEENVKSITGTINAIAYSWWSGIPDFENQSNFISRTTTGDVVAGARYCVYAIITSPMPASLYITQYKDSDNRNEINIASSFINNSVGENCFANGVRNNLKILALGNSFMLNSAYYLSQVANGIDATNLIVGDLYIGGVNMNVHLANLTNGTTAYSYREFANGIETEYSINKSELYGLKKQRWDAIIIHQYQPCSVMPKYQPYEPTMNLFIKKIIEILGYTPKFYILATWAGSLDSNETYYGFDTEMDMWEGVRDAANQASIDSGVINIIPAGTAIQNARTLQDANDYNRFVNIQGDDYHHLNIAGGFIASCTIYEKIVYPLNKKHCSNTTFRITTPAALPPQTLVETGIVVTDDNYSDFCQAAIAAVENPNAVTDLGE